MLNTFKIVPAEDTEIIYFTPFRGPGGKGFAQRRRDAVYQAINPVSAWKK